MLDRAGLTGETTALDGCVDVELVFHTGNGEGLTQDHLQHRTCEVFVDLFAVHFDLAGTRLDPNACNCVFPFASGVGTTQLVTNGLTRGQLFGCGFDACDSAQLFESVDLISHRH